MNLRRIYERCETCGHIELRHVDAQCPPKDRPLPGTLYRAHLVRSGLLDLPEWNYETFAGTRFHVYFDVEAYGTMDAILKADRRDFLVDMPHNLMALLDTQKPSHIWNYVPFLNVRTPNLRALSIYTRSALMR